MGGHFGEGSRLHVGMRACEQVFRAWWFHNWRQWSHGHVTVGLGFLCYVTVGYIHCGV